MLTAIAPNTNDPRYLHLAVNAWEMWNKATEIAESLWDDFESYFIDKILEMENKKKPVTDCPDVWEMMEPSQIPEK